MRKQERSGDTARSGQRKGFDEFAQALGGDGGEGDGEVDAVLTLRARQHPAHGDRKDFS